jgi:hypothetical protein
VKDLTKSPFSFDSFVFDGASDEGVTMADLVVLQQRVAKVEGPGAPLIPLSTMPDVEFEHGLEFQQPGRESIRCVMH